MSNNNKWFKKRSVSSDILQRIEVDELQWEVMAEKMHEDDVYDVAMFLGLDIDTMMSVLYSPCLQPKGLINQRIN